MAGHCNTSWFHRWNAICNCQREEAHLLKPCAPASMPLRQILSELMSDASLLFERQVALARIEAAQLAREDKRAAKLLGSGGLLAFAGVVLLLVALALAIGAALHTLWLGAIIVGGALELAAAALATVGWSARVKAPLSRSRRELEQEYTWARHQLTT
jgi:hypothetical protein